MIPLFEAIVESVPAPDIEDGSDFRMLVSNADWSDYVGRIAVGKVLSGSVRIGDPVWLSGGKRAGRAKVTKVFEYSALSTNDASEGLQGTSSASPVLRKSTLARPWPATPRPSACRLSRSTLPP